MIRKSILAMAVAAALSSTAAQAVVVGDIQLHSALNEALNADISLHRIDEAELEGLRVSLASPEAFARVGIERPYYLTGLQFMPMRSAAGDPVVHVSSTAAIRDPFLNFLVEVNWSKGKVLREFTLLLDPPTSYRGAAAQVAAPQTDFMASVQRRDVAEDAGATSYRVPANDTLWAIAKKHRHEGITTKQMLDAIFRNNPDAFIKNDINKLKAGKVLRIPSARTIAGPGYTKARHEYLAGASMWDATEPAMAGMAPAVVPIDARSEIQLPEDKGDRVELLTPDAAKPFEPGKGSFEEQTLGQLEKDLLLARELNEKVSSENSELQGRLKYLESQLNDLQRLLKLKHDTAAELQEETLLRQQTQEIQAQIEEVKTAAAEEAAKAEVVKEEAVAEAEAVKPEVASEVAEAPKTPADEPEAAKSETAPEVAEAPEAPAEEPEAAQPETAPEVAEVPEAPAEEPEAAQPETAPEVAEAPEAPAEEPEAAQPEAAPEVAEAPEAPAEKPEAAQPEATPEATEAPAEETEAAKPAVPEAEQDWLAWLLDNPAILAAGGGGLLLLVLLALKRRRAVVEAEQPKVVDVGPMGTGLPPGVSETLARDTLQVASDIQGDPGDSSLIVDFTPSELVGLRDEAEVDPVTEADVFMAYGRYQEAQKKLLEGLELAPGRNDIKLKLLEVLYVAGNKETFHNTATAYKNQGLAEQEPEGWRRIALLGQEIDSDDPIYQLGDKPLGVAEADAGSAADEPLDSATFEALESELVDMDSRRTEARDPYAAVLSDVAQDIAALDDEVEEGAEGPDSLGLGDLRLDDSSLLMQTKESDPLAELGAIDSGELDLSDLDLSRLEADSQVWPAEESEASESKNFEHEDILGQDNAFEPVIDFSSAEDQELLSSIEAATELQGVEIDSELSAVLDKASSEQTDPGRVGLESELSSLTQELENISADSELRLHPMDDDSLLAELKSSDPGAEDLSSTMFLESLAEGSLDLSDYDLGKDSINLEEELESLEGIGLDSTVLPDSAQTLTLDAGSTASEFDFEKELAELGALGIDGISEPKADTDDLGLDDLDLGGTSIDLEQELAGLDFLGGSTETADEDQVQTKLELAQAYIEMGDAEGAREILVEVQQDGSPEQQAQAQALLNSIG